MKANNEIRVAANTARVRLWEIADAIGLSDSSFSRKLRKEFSDTEKGKILGVIESLRRQKEEC